MAKHKPSVIYGLRKIDSRLKNGHIRTCANKDLLITLYEYDGRREKSLRLDRRTARLLAKRINQCLDDTK